MMGTVILPSGSSVRADHFEGSINLSHLINDLKNDDHTYSYRIRIIETLKELGKVARESLSSLKEIEKHISSSDTEFKFLAEHAVSAIKKIEEDIKSSNSVYSQKTVSETQRSSIHAKQTELLKIDFEEIESDFQVDRSFRQCSFCEKFTVVTNHKKRFSDKLASQFFCSNCLRNDYYKYNANIMVLTFRGIIGYYYYSYHVAPKTTASMYGTELDEYIKKHILVGFSNPLFRYDEESYCWFIDFGKIGKRKIAIDEILKTIVGQIAVFDLFDNVPNCSPKKFYDKFRNAITEFHNTRTRVGGVKIFAPTLIDCDIPTKVSGFRAIPVDMLENFLPSQLDTTYANRGNYRRW